MRLLFTVILLVSPLASAEAAKIEFSDCGSASRQRIQAAVDWLVSRLPDLDAHLGKSGLSDWSGKSRDRFAARLIKKKLRFSCHKDCSGSRFKVEKVGSSELIIGHGSRIPICTSAPYETPQIAAIIAHGLGHLVWINAHRRTCLERCSKPRLSTSLLKVTHHLTLGTSYDPAVCMASCGPVPGAAPAVETPATSPTPKVTEDSPVDL